MANIVRYEPMHELASLRRSIDSLFDDSAWAPLFPWRQLERATATVSPAVDVAETADEVIVTAALPGVKREDLDLSITGQALTMRGELKVDESIDEGQYVYRERRHGRFARTFNLPVRVDGDRATATFADGVLTLRIPKADEVKPRQIEIKD